MKWYTYYVLNNLCNYCVILMLYFLFSAGVGRTGVFLAIDMSLQKLEKGITDTVDVYGQVVEMRGRRMNMIQTLVRESNTFFVYFVCNID